MSTSSPSSNTTSNEDGVIAPIQHQNNGTASEAPQVVPPTNEAREPVRLHRKRLPHALSFEFGGASSPTINNTSSHQDQQGVSTDQGSFMLNCPANQSADAHILPLSGNDVDHPSCNTVDSGAASPLGVQTRSFMDGIQPIDSCMSGSGTQQQHPPNLQNISNTSPTTSTSNVFASQTMSGTPPTTTTSSMQHQLASAHRSSTSVQQQPATPITNSSITTYLNSTGQTFRMLPPTAAGGHSQPMGSDLFNSFFSAPTATPSLLSPQLHGADRPQDSCNGSFMLSPHQSTTNPSVYDSIAGAAGSTTTPGNTTPSQQYVYFRTQAGDMAMVPTGGGQQLPGSRTTPSTHPMDPHGGSTSPSQMQHSFPSNVLSGLSQTFHNSEIPPSSLENSRRGHHSAFGTDQQQQQQQELHTSNTQENNTNNRIYMFPHSPAQSTTEPTPILSPLVPDMHPPASSQHQYLVGSGDGGACSKSHSILSGQSGRTNFSTHPVQSQSSSVLPTATATKRKDNLYVSGLPSECRDKHLQRLFASFGKIVSASVRMDIRTGRSRGFGFVKYAEEPDAAQALAAMAGKQILTVTEGDNSFVNFITADELKARDGSMNSSSGNQINNTVDNTVNAPPPMSKMKESGGVVPTVLSASPISVVFAQNDADYHPGKLINKVFARNFPSTVSKERVKEFFEQFEGFVSLVYQVSSNDAADAAKSAMLSASSTTTTGTAPIVFISAYVTYDTVENAMKAAQGAHSTVPFPEEQRAAAIYMDKIRQEDQKRASGGRGWAPPQTEVDPIPILAKVAEAHDARKERLGKKATQSHHNDGQQQQQFRGGGGGQGGGDYLPANAGRRNTAAFNPAAHPTTTAAPHFMQQQQPSHHLHNLHHGGHQPQHIFTHQHHHQHQQQQSFVPAYHNSNSNNTVFGGHPQHAGFPAVQHQFTHQQSSSRPPQQHHHQQQQQQRIPPHYHQHNNNQQQQQVQFTHQQFPIHGGNVNSVMYQQGGHHHMSMMGMHAPPQQQPMQQQQQQHFDPFTMNQHQQQHRSYQH